MIGEKRPTYIRLSDDLYEKLKQIAEAEKRSFNAQAEYFLEKAADEYLKRQREE